MAFGYSTDSPILFLHGRWPFSANKIKEALRLHKHYLNISQSRMIKSNSITMVNWQMTMINIQFGTLLFKIKTNCSNTKGSCSLFWTKIINWETIKIRISSFKKRIIRLFQLEVFIHLITLFGYFILHDSTVRYFQF